jgi:DUF4097 and DUF4098 domain-containing protein YvlB
MQKFATSAPVTAHVDIPAGRIQLIAADRADTTVEVRPATPGRSRDAKAAEEVEVSYRDGVLRIEARKPRNRHLGHSGSVEVTVQLPAGSHVEAKAAGAELRGVGRLGDVAFEGQQATVKLDETAGARLNVMDGDITVGRLGDSAELRTMRGNLTVAEAMGGHVTLSTMAGDIALDAARGVSASLDAGTACGRVSNSLRNAEGTPALAVHATTSMGDISARSL